MIECENNNGPKISVVMSVYNGEEFLQESVESILNQTFTDFEFIIINDGSTDSTPKILEEYAARDKRIVLIQQENMGLTRSLNKGIKVARGKFIARHDADDISFINRLEKLYFIARQTGSDIVGSQAYSYINNKFKINPKTEYLENISLSRLKFGNIFVHGTLFFKSKLLKQYMYDEEFRYAQDYELVTRLLKSNKSIYIINDVLYFLRISDESISNIKKDKQIRCAKLICKKHFGTTLFLIPGKNIFFRALLISLRKLTR